MGLIEVGAEIIAIEDSDAVGWIESATTIGEINFNSATTMVDAVISELGGRKLQLLHVQAHGSSTGIALGSDWVTTTSFSRFSATLGRLTAKFTRTAWVDLRACNVGENLPLMHEFRRLWGVGVVAGRWRQSNLLDANLGLYQIVTRDGTELKSFTTPPWVQYNAARRTVHNITSHIL